MNTDTIKNNLPALVNGVLMDDAWFKDNIVCEVWKKLKMGSLIVKAGFKKRAGMIVTDVPYWLMIWRWLSAQSIAMFSSPQSLASMPGAKKDVMYDFLKREELNWRGLHSGVAKAVYAQQGIGGHALRAYVLDESIKHRRGKKMEAVSSHFDHPQGRHVMGHQVLTLGRVTEHGFLPLASPISISDCRTQEVIQPCRDGRRPAARRDDLSQLFSAIIKQNPTRSCSGHETTRGQYGGASCSLLAAWFRAGDDRCYACLLSQPDRR